jgi:hypothetical protein
LHECGVYPYRMRHAHVPQQQRPVGHVGDRQSAGEHDPAERAARVV